jgi:ABC-type glycerol-3-phosphate transport system substrate-binding protein
LGEEQLAVDPWPVYREGKGLAGYSWTRNAYFASAASSTDYSASWVFVRFLLTPEAQAAFAQAGSGRQVPVLTSLQVEERWLAELIEAMHGNIMLPIYPELDIFAELFEFEARDVGLRKSEIDYATNRLLVKLARELPQDVTD